MDDEDRRGAPGGPGEPSPCLRVSVLVPDESPLLGGNDNDDGDVSDDNEDRDNGTGSSAMDDKEGRSTSLDSDADLIVRLMPLKPLKVVQERLQCLAHDPRRVQIVLNEFLEEEAVVNQRSYEPEEGEGRRQLKNKTGNGLKCKNSNHYQNVAYKKIKLEPVSSSCVIVDEETCTGDGPSSPAGFSQPLQSGQDNFTRAEASSSGSPFLSASAASTTGKSSMSFHHCPASGSSRKERSKIQLSEDHLHGPFNFSDHRKRPASHSKGASRQQQSRLSSDVIIQDALSSWKLRPDLLEAMRSSRGGLRESGAKASPSPQADQSITPSMSVPPSPSPPLVDLGSDSSTPCSPDVVDLSQPDQQEIVNLVQSLAAMFPETSIKYLEEKAIDLVGKPTATDRFIEELLSRNSLPPEEWIAKEGDRFETKATNSSKNQAEDGKLNLNPPSPVAGPSNWKPTFFNDDHFIPGSSGMSPNDEENEEDEDSSGPSLGKQPRSDADCSAAVETEEEKINKRLDTLIALFPNTDPEFLHEKATSFGFGEDDVRSLNNWIAQGVENDAKEYPSRAEYEKRRKEAELLEKYSRQLTVKEILEMYDDPEAYFSDPKRKVSELYKKHSLGQLKKDFRHVGVASINVVFDKYQGLYLLCVRALQKYNGTKRKTRRPDHECGIPQQICFNFLKELQYTRIEDKVKTHIEAVKDKRRTKIEDARKERKLQECPCCFNDECLKEELLPCRDGHLFCRECVQRASEVAIGDAKTQLACLGGECEEQFELATLQKALHPNMFSKWLKRIQLAEIEKADIEGLEQCPFCPFATIMDTTPEENKVFHCLNPDCGKESCRLCKEISHIPLRCDEIEKDAEVRKRTYIENKMSEAMIRKCWKCQRPFFKTDGCNKMTCECGAQMCYLCRKPVKDYKHFYGLGGTPKNGMCPLFCDNAKIHQNDVARGALEAKSEMDRENPNVALKFDPTSNIKAAEDNDNPEARDGLEGILPQDPFERNRMVREQHMIEFAIMAQRQRVVVDPQHLAVLYQRRRALSRGLPPPHPHPPAQQALHPAAAPAVLPHGHVHLHATVPPAAPPIPAPALGVQQGGGNFYPFNHHHNPAAGFHHNLPQQPQTVVAPPPPPPQVPPPQGPQPHHQQQAMFTRAPAHHQGQHLPALPQPQQRPPPQPHPQQQQHHHQHLQQQQQQQHPNWQNGFVYRMGELLQLREAQRQRQRAIRRREQQALEEYQIHRFGAGVVPAAPPQVPQPRHHPQPQLQPQPLIPPQQQQPPQPTTGHLTHNLPPHQVQPIHHAQHHQQQQPQHNPMRVPAPIPPHQPLPQMKHQLPPQMPQPPAPTAPPAPGPHFQHSQQTRVGGGASVGDNVWTGRYPPVAAAAAAAAAAAVSKASADLKVAAAGMQQHLSSVTALNRALSAADRPIPQHMRPGNHHFGVVPGLFHEHRYHQQTIQRYPNPIGTSTTTTTTTSSTPAAAAGSFGTVVGLYRAPPPVPVATTSSGMLGRAPMLHQGVEDPRRSTVAGGGGNNNGSSSNNSHQVVHLRELCRRVPQSPLVSTAFHRRHHLEPSSSSGMDAFDREKTTTAQQHQHLPHLPLQPHHHRLLQQQFSQQQQSMPVAAAADPPGGAQGEAMMIRHDQQHPPQFLLSTNGSVLASALLPGGSVPRIIHPSTTTLMSAGGCSSSSGRPDYNPTRTSDVEECRSRSYRSRLRDLVDLAETVRSLADLSHPPKGLSAPARSALPPPPPVPAAAAPTPSLTSGTAPVGLSVSNDEVGRSQAAGSSVGNGAQRPSTTSTSAQTTNDPPAAKGIAASIQELHRPVAQALQEPGGSMSQYLELRADNALPPPEPLASPKNAKPSPSSPRLAAEQSDSDDQYPSSSQSNEIALGEVAASQTAANPGGTNLFKSVITEEDEVAVPAEAGPVPSNNLNVVTESIAPVGIPVECQGAAVQESEDDESCKGVASPARPSVQKISSLLVDQGMDDDLSHIIAGDSCGAPPPRVDEPEGTDDDVLRATPVEGGPRNDCNQHEGYLLGEPSNEPFLVVARPVVQHTLEDDAEMEPPAGYVLEDDDDDEDGSGGGGGSGGHGCGGDDDEPLPASNVASLAADYDEDDDDDPYGVVNADTAHHQMIVASVEGENRGGADETLGVDGTGVDADMMLDVGDHPAPGTSSVAVMPEADDQALFGEFGLDMADLVDKIDQVF